MQQRRPELRIDVVAAAEQGAEERDLLGRRFGYGVSGAGSFGPIARAQVIERRELGLEASEFIARRLSLTVESD